MGFVKTVVAVTVGVWFACFINTVMPAKFNPQHVGAHFAKLFVSSHSDHE